MICLPALRSDQQRHRSQHHSQGRHPAAVLPGDLRETRHLLPKLLDLHAGVVEKPPLDGSDHLVGELPRHPSIGPPLPRGRPQVHPVPVTRSFGSSNPVPLSPLRHTSQLPDLRWSVLPSFHSGTTPNVSFQEKHVCLLGLSCWQKRNISKSMDYIEFSCEVAYPPPTPAQQSRWRGAGPVSGAV